MPDHIQHIIEQVKEAQPDIDIIRLQRLLSKEREDDLYRIANAIDTYGFQRLLEAMDTLRNKSLSHKEQ